MSRDATLRVLQSNKDKAINAREKNAKTKGQPKGIKQIKK